MSEKTSLPLSRRRFLAATGGALAAGPVAARSAARAAESAARPQVPTPPAASRKLPIGVFDPVYSKLSLDQMLDTISALKLEAVEIGTGGYPGSAHCPVDELLADPARARAWKKKFRDRNILVGALSCHGNPIHPDSSRAARDAEIFRKTVRLAERLEVPVVVGFSGCPGGSSADKTPSWVTYRWPPEFDQAIKYQWDDVAIPYWRDAARFARQHGVRKLAFEMHPNMLVYNPKTLLRLREAVGEEIGANCDLSHLFWQGCDPIETIRLLGKNQALFHAHMKDTVLYEENIAKYGVLNFAFETTELPAASEIFRAVGYGHGASLWKQVIQAYMEVGYQGMLSIENEDPILTGEVGVERAAYVLKNVRDEILKEA